MKDFTRQEPLFSLCGLKCGLCTMYIGGYCPGCGGGDGNQPCPIAKCSICHGHISYCFQCGEYPCAQYDEMEPYDSFIPGRFRQKDMDRAQQLGLEVYLEELHEKMAILQRLLENYNDGRRKSFFCTAVYLLELADIQAVMRTLEGWEGVEGLPIKEKALIAVRLFQELADQQGVSLKLVKKPKKTAQPPQNA